MMDNNLKEIVEQQGINFNLIKELIKCSNESELQQNPSQKRKRMEEIIYKFLEEKNDY